MAAPRALCCAAMRDDDPIRYIERTCTYYQALGYGPPYRWTQFDDVPFHRLERPLDRCRVALVTTAAPYRPEAGDQGPGAPYNAAAKFYRVYSAPTEAMPDLRISHVAIDRDHTAAGDIATYFPLAALWQAEAEGRIGAVAPQFHGLPTNRSQRTTIETDAPEIVRRVREDQADAAILVANCPVCHQCCALAARALDEAGIPAVLMGSALDIVEHVGVARLLFSDLPLGNAAGPPRDVAAQRLTLGLALDMLEQADAPRSTWHTPVRWPGDPDWKRSYCNVDALTPGEIARRRAAFDDAKVTARALRRG
jgi:glycine/betaine/sarcosine/D-proline reductase family selenoprotein B